MYKQEEKVGAICYLHMRAVLLLICCMKLNFRIAWIILGKNEYLNVCCKEDANILYYYPLFYNIILNKDIAYNRAKFLWDMLY